MKTLPFFSTLWRSGWDLSVYRDAAVVRTRHAVLYYLGLLVIGVALLGWAHGNRIVDTMEQTRRELALVKLPEFEIKDGRLVLIGDQLRHHDFGRFHVLLDANNKLEKSPQSFQSEAEGEATLWIGSKRLVLIDSRPGRYQARTVELSNFPDFAFNRTTADQFLKGLEIVAVFSAVFFLFVFGGMLDLISALGYALVVLGIFSIRRVPLGFGGAFNIALVAHSAPTVLAVLADFATHGSMRTFLPYYLVYSCYVVLGAAACRPAEEPTVQATPDDAA